MLYTTTYRMCDGNHDAEKVNNTCFQWILCTFLNILPVLLALSAFLDDGFEERVLDEESKSLQVLRLHPKIAPINVVILAEDTTNEEQADLVDRLSKELKVVGKSHLYLSSMKQRVRLCNSTWKQFVA